MSFLWIRDICCPWLNSLDTHAARNDVVRSKALQGSRGHTLQLKYPSAWGSTEQAVTPRAHHVSDSLAAQAFVDRSGTWREPPLCSKWEQHLWNEFPALLPCHRATLTSRSWHSTAPRGAARSRRAAAARTPTAALGADLEALRAVL